MQGQIKAWFRFIKIQKLCDSCILFEKYNLKQTLKQKTIKTVSAAEKKEFNKGKDMFYKKRASSRCKSDNLWL